MNLTDDDIKEIIQSEYIDHQKLKVINLGKDLYYLVSNQISDQGCKYLSKSNWPNL